MSVLIFAETSANEYKKSSLEALYFGSQIGNALAVVMGNEPVLKEAGKYGVMKVISVSQTDAQHLAKIITDICQKNNISTLIFPQSTFTQVVAGRVATQLQAALVNNVVELPTISGEKMTVKQSIFTGKAFANTQLKTQHKILIIKKNAISPVASSGEATVETMTISSESKLKVTNKISVGGDSIPLPEADRVVSAGRGLKGPENWGIVEDLAKALGAATACSKPVSDLDWRPHHEHVGQTGIKVAPNLYIACGISGAIQHLAGVNSSKVIVVINKDPDAPFFQAADYGIIGDVFDVLPKLTKALRG